VSAARAAIALTGREMTRLGRQPTRLVSALVLPALLWVLAGAGLAGSFADPGVASDQALSYSATILPGIVTAVIVFGTIVASMSLIQDRQAGFLQAVLVSPAPAWTIVASKIAGGAAVTTIQAGILLLTAPLVGLRPSAGAFLLAIVAVAVTTVAVISLGLALAWWINSTSGFHGVMNGLLVPMWLLSGAMFPVEGAAHWLAWLVHANPLHWHTRTIGAAIGVGGAGAWEWSGSIAFAVACCIGASVTIARGRSSAGADPGD